MSVRWIERAEARQVLMIALSERPSPVSASDRSRRHGAAALWAALLRRLRSASAPQQIGQRRDGAEPPQSVNQLEDPIDPLPAEAA